MEALRRRWRQWFGRRALDQGLDEEIRFHLEHQIDKNLRVGMAPAEARRQAMIAFGALERAKADTRDEFRGARLEQVIRELRHASRALVRAPVYTVVVVLVLALGIGATTAMFSVVNGVLLRSLPYPDGERLVELLHEAPGLGIDEIAASPAVYFGYRDHSRVFDAVGLWDWDSSPVSVATPDRPEAVRSVEVTQEVLRMLGAEPVQGRLFGPADDAPGAVATVVVSHAYWQRRFGGGDLVGRSLVVDGMPREVIGVLSPGFRFFDYPAEIFYPLQPVRSEAVFPSGDGRGLARLKPGVTLEQANADVARMIPILDAEFPGSLDADWQFAPRLTWLRDAVVGDVGATLWLLMGTIGLLLLIACANVANLTLLRCETRRRELAVRAALGAGRGVIVRVVLTESVLLGIAGGAIGLTLAHVCLPWLLSLGADDLPAVLAVSIDPVVVLATVALTVMVILGVGLAPVVHGGLRKLQLAPALRGGHRSVAGGRATSRVRQTLVVAQVALTLVLLVGSGLMLRTFQGLRQVDPGFRDVETVQTFQLTIPDQAVPGAAASGSDSDPRLRMHRQIVDRLRAIPGVVAVGLSSFNDGLPLDGDGKSTAVYVEGRSVPEGPVALKEVQFVSPGFFETLRTPLLAGRSFEWRDIDQQRPVALVSENLARSTWGSADAALGQRLGVAPAPPWSEVVGVVADVRHDGVSRPAPEVVVFPPVASDVASFVVRSDRVGTAALLDDLQGAVSAVTPGVALANVQTLGGAYERSLLRTTTTLQLLAVAGVMALLLGVVGIYGLVGYAVSEQRHEIGIRMALGAGRGSVHAMFVSRALALAVAGVLAGALAAAGLSRFLASQLYGVSPLDPVTYLGVAGLLLGAAGLASYLSARRGAAVDPVSALRHGV